MVYIFFHLFIHMDFFLTYICRKPAKFQCNFIKSGKLP